MLAHDHRGASCPPHQFHYAARQLAQQSLQNSVSLGQHQGGVPISVGPWPKSEASALQADSSGSVTRQFHQPSPPASAGRRRLPRRSEAQAGRTSFTKGSYGSASQPNFQLRETRLKYRGKPHKLLQVGVIPTPATNSLFNIVGNEWKPQFLKAFKADMLLPGEWLCYEW